MPPRTLGPSHILVSRATRLIAAHKNFVEEFVDYLQIDEPAGANAEVFDLYELSGAELLKFCVENEENDKGTIGSALDEFDQTQINSLNLRFVKRAA